MERLWAPWRLTYLKGDPATDQSVLPPVDLLPGADADCFVCQAAGLPQSTDGKPVDLPAADKERLVVQRSAHTVTLLNRYPYNNGHLLISPRRHVAGLQDLSDEENSEISLALRETTRLLEQLIQPQGFNIGLNLGRAAGAGIPGHLHWHVVPRWSGDSNFISVTGDARVISQSLDELWTLLTTAWLNAP